MRPGDNQHRDTFQAHVGRVERCGRGEETDREFPPSGVGYGLDSLIQRVGIVRFNDGPHHVGGGAA